MGSNVTSQQEDPHRRIRTSGLETLDGWISTFILNWHFFVLDLVLGILFHFMRKLKDIEQPNIGETE